MKKKIFIFIYYLEIGGVETSLIHLLRSFDLSKYDIDLFILSHKGELMNFIPKGINVLPEIREYAQLNEYIFSLLKNGYFKIPLLRLWAKLKFFVYSKRNHLSDNAGIYQYIIETVLPYLPDFKKNGIYDLAISFVIPHMITLEKVAAKKKIAWIHTDYSTVQVNVKKELSVWNRYDYIASISDEVTKAFLKTFPSLRDKIVLIENILCKDLIIERANEFQVSFSKEHKRINFLSIGRFSYPKNFDNVPDICKRIRKAGYNVYWHIIGYGGDEALIRQKIIETGMQDYVLLLGKKENPYPYILACDFYIQPSRYEGKAVTVREAQMLGKLVIITDYPTARSQVNYGKDGVIVPLENELCAKEIIHFLNNEALQKQVVNHLIFCDFSNSGEIRKLEDLC